MEQELLQREKEIDKFSTELHSKELQFNIDLENYYIKHLNESPEYKLELFKRNTSNAYRTNFSEAEITAEITQGIYYDSSLKPSLSIEEDYLYDVFGEIFKDDRFLVTNKMIFVYEPNAMEVIAYTDKLWREVRQKEVNDRFMKFISACSNQSHIPEKPEFQEKKVEGFRIISKGDLPEISLLVEEIKNRLLQINICHKIVVYNARISFTESGKAIEIQCYRHKV
jgi:hypothetical protein